MKKFVSLCLSLCLMTGAAAFAAAVPEADVPQETQESGAADVTTEELQELFPELKPELAEDLLPEAAASPLPAQTLSPAADPAVEQEPVAVGAEKPYIPPVETGIVVDTNSMGYAYKSTYTDDTVLDFKDPQHISDKDFFGKYLNYDDYEGLAPVKAAAEAGDYALAKQEFLNYYRVREKQYPTSAGGNGKRDRLMSDLLEHNYTYNTNSGYTCVELPTVESHDYQLVEVDVTEELKVVADSASRDMPFYMTARNKDGAQVSILSKEYGDGTQGARILVEANGAQTPFHVTDDAMVTAGEGTNDSKNYKEKTELLLEESLSSVNYNTPVEEGYNKPKHFPADENTKRIHMKFNLEGVAQTSSIKRATLQFYAKINDLENTVNRKDVVVFVTKNADWNEDTVCYNTTSNYVFSYEHEPAIRWHRPHFGAPGHRYTDELFRWNWDRTNALYFYNFGNESVRERYAYTSLRQLASYLTWFGGYDVAPLHHWGSSGTVQIDSHLGVALRNNMLTSKIINFVESKHMTPELFAAAVKFMWLEGEYAYKKVPSTSNIGAQEISGGYKTAVYFKEFETSETWINKAISNAVAYMKTYMQKDGSCTEVGLGYITYALDGITGITKTADARNEKLKLDAGTLQIMSEFADYLVYISGPGGREIQQGQGNTIDDTTIINTLKKIYELTGNPHAQYIVTGGKEGTAPPQTSKAYTVGQKYSMRSDWNKAAVFLQTNADGAYKTHGDPDDLSIILWAYDQYLLADPLYSSYQGGGASNWLMGTVGHNTVVVNDTSQMKPQSEDGKGTTNYWESNGVYDFLDVSTKNYANQNVKHARKIFYVKPGYYLVSDYLEPTDGKTKNYKQGWHFLPTAGLTISEDGNTLTTHMSGANIHVSTAVGDDVKGELRSDGFYGMGHNAVVGDVKWGTFEQESNQNAVFNTILYPEEIGKNNLVNVTSKELPLQDVKNNGVSAMKVDIDDTKSGVRSEGTFYLVHDKKQAAQRSFDSFTTNGTMSYVEKKNAKVHTLAFQGGTELLGESGAPYLVSKKEISDLGVKYESGKLELSSSDEKLKLEDVTVYAPASMQQVVYNGSPVDFQRTGDYIYFGNKPGVEEGAQGPEQETPGGDDNGNDYPTPERPPHGGGGGGGGTGPTVPPVGPVDPVNPVDPVGPTKPASRYFSDVGADYEWAAASIDKLYEKGIVKGESETSFAPERQVTRGEYIKMLTGALGIAPDASAELPFGDVSKDDWAYPYIAAAYQAGIVRGVSETEFGADAPISREDIAVMTDRALTAAGKTMEKTAEGKGFADDNQAADYAAQSIRNMQEYGILTGTPEGYFKPKDLATRAECAKVVCGLLD